MAFGEKRPHKYQRTTTKSRKILHFLLLTNFSFIRKRGNFAENFLSYSVMSDSYRFLDSVVNFE
jgi:hypothetical protein